MTDLQKLELAGVLQALALAGFTVRGFTQLSATRGSGNRVVAEAISKDGAVVTELAVGALRRDRLLQLDWYQDGERQSTTFAVLVSDEGELRLADPTSTQRVGMPEKPLWR